MLCYSFVSDFINNHIHIDEKYVKCPDHKCLNHEYETWSSIVSIPCYRTGFISLSYRIDRLRFNDRFNINKSSLYSDLIITTTDIHRQALHVFSKNLIESCITRRFIVIVNPGRLEIPLLNLKSSYYFQGLVWHGNYSTFEILHISDV